VRIGPPTGRQQLRAVGIDDPVGGRRKPGRRGFRRADDCRRSVSKTRCRHDPGGQPQVTDEPVYRQPKRKKAGPSDTSTTARWPSYISACAPKAIVLPLWRSPRNTALGETLPPLGSTVLERRDYWVRPRTVRPADTCGTENSRRDDRDVASNCPRPGPRRYALDGRYAG
jgi:hypothetical protein